MCDERCNYTQLREEMRDLKLAIGILMIREGFTTSLITNLLDLSGKDASRLQHLLDDDKIN